MDTYSTLRLVFTDSMIPCCYEFSLKVSFEQFDYPFHKYVHLNMTSSRSISVFLSGWVYFPCDESVSERTSGVRSAGRGLTRTHRADRQVSGTPMAELYAKTDSRAAAAAQAVLGTFMLPTERGANTQVCDKYIDTYI